jgi:GDP-L-fucose synthase
MPTNLYGPGDNFSQLDSHVLPAFIRRFHEAVESNAGAVTIWGTGTPRREFLHADDFAAAVCMLMERYSEEAPINIGCGDDVSIKELAQTVSEVAGFKGKLEFDASKPDGTPRKLLDVSRIRALGWTPQVTLRTGITSTYEWYRSHLDKVRHS